MKNGALKGKHKRGRPRYDGIRRCVFLTMEDYTTLINLGRGSLSIGIRHAAGLSRDVNKNAPKDPFEPYL